jgi:hypothetical protein
MSTSAEIGRWPALLSRPAAMRARRRCHADDDAAVEGRAALGIVGADLDGQAKLPATGAAAIGFNVPSPAAARSRAMP